MKADDSPCSQTDPLGLARFLKQNVSETKISTENARVATTDECKDTTATNEVTIQEPKDATGTTTSESKDATATEEYVTINVQSFMTVADYKFYCAKNRFRVNDIRAAAGGHLADHLLLLRPDRANTTLEE